ncbi:MULTISPECIES: glycosyltransferase [unclassified Tolypothrix]|uniref:glycosyltransferase n=1 Tax=unclassified Tolypothrix TaxID=2649714 RepID=UPI0005EAB953|nr:MULTISPECIES: glycosyltransferase [unclassified Tolypothrix]EKE97146.1 glycosyl transferase family 2 [Tolypothrix sp. PCC 7601]MBE9082675.1 glycosyltransferase [Tolypothrix sp. LEGE 11397]UYD29242.1 glycosyltransferase [Tolypothrix sp. PCC 7712]UYD34846.1 glycosyltransferase [Tolypothrix sp. PCC 7601]
MLISNFNQPLISVVLPVFNGAKTISETVQSVLNQTFVNWELIIINDGSQDSTLDIIEKFESAEPRLRIFSYPNAGLAASRNRGIALSLGEYISFIDADDLWTPNKLKSQLTALQEQSKAFVAYSWTDYIDANGKFVKSGGHTTDTGDVYQKLLLWNFIENGSNPLVRKEVFDTVGGFDESLSAAEDWDMWLRLAARYEFVVIPEVQVLYRLSMNSMSANLKRQESTCLTVINKAFAAPRAESLGHLKKHTISNIYKYLTFRSLEVDPDKVDRWISTLFLWKTLRYNPKFYTNTRIIFIAIFRIIFPSLYFYLKRNKRVTL